VTLYLPQKPNNPVLFLVAKGGPLFILERLKTGWITISEQRNELDAVVSQV
jgi:hypothetical protein